MSSPAADERIFEADLAVDQARVVMLASQNIIESEVTSEALAVLDEVEAAGYDTLSGSENVRKAIEVVVTGIVSPNGGRMHITRSRSDEVTTCIRYRLREDMLSALDAALALRESSLEMATAYAKTVIPGYAHLQPV